MLSAQLERDTLPPTTVKVHSSSDYFYKSSQRDSHFKIRIYFYHQPNEFQQIDMISRTLFFESWNHFV